MRLEIQCEDRIGMVREVLDLFVPHQIDIRLIEADTVRHCIYCGFPDIEFAKLQQLLGELRRLGGVQDVKRVTFTPSEREHNALHTLLEALPDGVIAVDLKGIITMATDLAAQDLGVPITELLSRPLQQFIKGVSFAKVTWDDIVGGVSMRIRIRNKALLLEMKPIFVPDEEGNANPAGSVIHLKSQARLDRQAANFKQAPNAENDLAQYFQAQVSQSSVMREMLHRAKAFANMPEPLFIQGEAGTGKRDLVRALFQYWLAQQFDQTAQLIIRHGRDMHLEEVAKLDHLNGWLVIEELEYLSPDVQVALANWLTRRPEFSTSFESNCRIVSLSTQPQSQLISQYGLNRTLYFALSGLFLQVPSLKERREDLAGLLQQTLQAYAERYGVPMPKVSKGALLKLSLYSWPGNHKELQNVCLQTLSVSQQGEWQPETICLPEDTNKASLVLLDGSLDKTLKHFEATLLKSLYPDHPSTRKLAKAVGVSHSAIANKLKEYGIH
ncbi:TyrR/PhhR family helix-turn-helix DNA-binding protein [Marinomonas pollencensis]|uniref:Transcriptional regulator of aroF, aroG, tyrA and aromatic amino acid transport n=1 Tax=Marinomonas pollencensis TaxID=491954 RepID=A0A3E0DSE7_9GAMM|nr:TyrR/PhhR family helix-turn-helix DNA-binding protein [Marinomonas pollencensis]REG86467.1 transcriptional regulator of aroF, aroG, tyrA and aromatic amino acid transport [Marinomonas pollencensis]